MGRGLQQDSAPPVVTLAREDRIAGGRIVRARAHDRKSPTLPTEWEAVEVRFVVGGVPGAVDMTWYGEYLWRAVVPEEAAELEVCATDAAGLTGCMEVVSSPETEPGE